MIKNYFKVAFRNMRRRKSYALLNIAGLAIGMAVCLFIMLFVQNECSFDKFNINSDRIYRVVLERHYPGRSSSYATIPFSIGEAIHQEFPEVKQSMRLFQPQGDQGYFIRIGDKVFQEKNVLYADSNFFNLFTIPLLKGNPDRALALPNSIVLTESTAKKYFGSVADAIGKNITVDDSTYIITGISKDVPVNAHFTFDFLASSASFNRFLKDPDYITFSAYTYLLLNPGANANALEAKLPSIVEKYVSGQIERSFGVSYKEFIKEGNGYHYYLQPLTQIHLTSSLDSELEPNGSLTTVRAFSVIAFFILLLACINFINLSTARSLDRAKEVGMRKTFGSERSAIILQFLFESIITSIISVILAVLLVLVFTPFCNNLFYTRISGLDLLHPIPLALIFSTAIIIGILAGLYPAIVLSSFQPIIVLRGKFSLNPKGRLVRNTLVVFQFAISVILIIATLVVNGQMQYMLGNEIGFKKDNVIELKRTDLLDKQSESFKDDLYKIPGVENVSGTSAMPGEQNYFGVSFQATSVKEPLTGRGLIVDDQYLNTLHIPLVKGRFFSKDIASDSLTVVLNEKAVAELGIPNPIGTQLTSPDGLFNAPDGNSKPVTVIGIVKDFHYQSLQEPITPLILMNSAKFQNNTSSIAVSIQAGQLKNVLTAINKTWDRYVPGHPFQFSFLDQQLADIYHAETTTERLFTAFSALAIFIACLGLLGLVMYNTQKRLREISIRKVLGANVTNIVSLLSQDLLRLVVIAFVIASPVAWLFMNQWLQDYAYRINIGWLIFLETGIAALTIAFLTLSIHAVRAAISNPTKSLRAE